jgi:recombination protein RecT
MATANATAKPDLKSNLAAQAAIPAEKKTVDPAADVKSYLARLAPEMAKALPKHLTADRLARVTLTAIRMNPKLLQCRIPSLMAAVMRSAQLGLEIGVNNQAYLVPYGAEAQFIIGYEGYIDLFYRSGQVQGVFASAVYKGDEFAYEYGLNAHLKHIPCGNYNQDEITHFYAYVKMKDGAFNFIAWPRSKVDAHAKQYSKSLSKSDSPWKTNYPSMGAKTMIRQLQKFIPKSVELREALSQDGAVGVDPFKPEADFVPFTEVGPEALPAGEEVAESSGQPAAGAAPEAPKPAAATAAAPASTPADDFTAGAPLSGDAPNGPKGDWD